MSKHIGSARFTRVLLVLKSSILVSLCLVLTGFNAQAVTLTYSSTAPTLESSYVYHLGESTTDAGNVEGVSGAPYTNDAATYIAHDRQGLGQTFTTGPGAYLINGFWLKHVDYSGLDDISWWNTDSANTSPNLEIRVTDPSAAGTPAFELSVESYIVTGNEPDDSLIEGNGVSGLGTGTWIHFELDTPVLLAGNTEYGFDVTSFNTGSNYYFETAGLDGADSYTGGTAYSSGSGGGTNSLNMDNIHNGDHVFIAELTPVMPENGDITGNGKVDLFDLAMLGNGWRDIYDITGLRTVAANWLFIVPPVFIVDPIFEADATSNFAYNGTLNDDVKYYDVSQLSFSKESGPTWLTVDPNGVFFGTPSSSDEGTNSFTVQVADGINPPDQATLQINVKNLPLYSHSMKPVYLNNFKVQGFWKTQYKRQITQWLIHCIDTLDTNAEGIPQFIEAKKALDGLPHASHTGYVFSDAYTHNTVEAMCLALSIDADGDQDIIDAQNYIQTKLDEWIPIILDVQQSDGYIDTIVINTIDSGYVRYSNRSNHECYVQAYFIESGVAHYQMTNGQDRTLYNAAKKCGDHLYDTFLVPQRVYSNGHEVIEMALCRLGRLVNEVEGQGAGNKYIDTAKWLLDCRGGGSEYDQNHLPVIQQTDAVGHAVRACYLYTGMTDISLLQQDTDYTNAVDNLWDSAVNRKMYLTGGVGSTGSGEAFAGDYVLPNDSGYCETCASCGLIFWNNRMNWHYHDAKYADVVERTIYNNVLSSVDLAGQNYYYQQPLDQSNARYAWHSCPCCVGNIPRTLMALKDKAYLLDEDTNSLYVNYFIAGSGTIDDFDGMQIGVEQITDYPYSGIINLIVNPQVSRDFSIKIRIPDRTERELYTATPEINSYNSIEVNGSPVTPAIVNGYATIERTWGPGDTITLDLPMEVQMVKSVPAVSANTGRVALQYGPLVYNLESVDHGISMLDSIYIEPTAVLTTNWNTDLLGEGVLTLQGTAKLKTTEGYQNIEVVSIPNYTRLNRGGRTIVWVADNEDAASAALTPPEPGSELIWHSDDNGGPYTLNGVSDYISLPDGIVENCSDFTIAAWVWLDALDTWSRIFDFGTGTTVNMFLTPQSGSNTLRFAITTGGGGAEQQINGSSPLATGSWQHVAVTLSGTTGRLYLNGSEIASSSISIAPYLLRTTDRNYIGRSQYSDPYLDGQVDDFRIYNYALSETEIANLSTIQP